MSCTGYTLVKVIVVVHISDGDKIINKKNATKQKIDKHHKFRNCVLRHLNCRKNDYKGKDIFVARFHFPYEYLNTKGTNFRLMSTLLDEVEAERYGIKVHPDSAVSLYSL